MIILLVRPTDKARSNFESRVEGMDVTVVECSKQQEVQSILDSLKVDMALIFLHKADSELVWIIGTIMDREDIRVVGLMENDEVDIQFERNMRRKRNKVSRSISFHQNN